MLKSILPVIKLPPSGTMLLRTDSGSIKLHTNQTSYLTQILFWKGYKQFEYSGIFEELIKKVSCFLDIGSNIGYYALLASRSNPNTKVYAFEPAHGPKHYLQKNIRSNDLEENIALVEVALSNFEGQIDFYEVGNEKYKFLKYNLAGEGNAGTKTTSRNFVKSTVSATTLDAFVSKENLTKIDLIKIDTEGTELDILDSGRNTIQDFQPIVICETLFNTIEPGLERFFKDRGYLFFNHTEKGLLRCESIVRQSDDGIRNCFFVPPSKLNMIEEFVIG